MKTIGRYIPKRMRGSSTALCAVCGSTFYRRQLVRGRDGMLRCSGAGTFNDARGRIAMELDELNANEAQKPVRRFTDDPGPLETNDI